MNILTLSLDIHCHVVDNYGDAGIAFRLAKAFKNKYQLAKVRLFIDDILLLNKLALDVVPTLVEQIVDEIMIVDTTRMDMNLVTPATLVIKLLETPLPAFYSDRANKESELILTIEGVSAQSWVKDIHGSFSFNEVKAKKAFFIPGFIKESGGILLTENKKSKDFLKKLKLKHNITDDALIGVLFHYDGELKEVFNYLTNRGKPTFIFVCGEKSQQIVQKITIKQGDLHFIYQELIPQSEFDVLLSNADFNFIRGEDSMMQSINCATPFLWQIYPQKDNVHIQKLDAFINMLGVYFEDKKVFVDYAKLTNFYNGIQCKDADVERIIYSFFNNLDKIKHVLAKLKANLLKEGDLLERLARFIKQI